MKFSDVVCGLMCIAWCIALFFIAEPNPVVDWRVVAAFTQAFLSAAAIYGAWWLQNRKRAEDRLEAERDTMRIIAYMSYLAEWEVSGLIKMAKSDRMVPLLMKISQKSLEEIDAILRRQNLAHVPADGVMSLVSIMQRTTQAAAILKLSAETMAADDKFNGNLLRALYFSLFEARSKFLIACKLDDEGPRLLPKDLFPEGNVA